jgi:outer membrane protein assembly factor BamD (BamD/ComL family)
MIGPFAAGQEKKPAPQQQQQAPPEEDEQEKPKEYSFNPLQAEKEMRVGNFYFHKGDFRAAANRFREATNWNPTAPEPYLRLGESEEKQRSWKAAREAYEKFLELAADDKRAPEVRKKLEKISKDKH